MSKIAIIGGSGLTSLKGLEIQHRQIIHTPFGLPSAPLVHGLYSNKPVVFLPRHGNGHTIPPHQINYRANIWTLHHLGIKKVIAIAAVGSLNSNMRPTDLVIPHQLVDYTSGRKHTFYEKGPGPYASQVEHVDFTTPYCSDLRHDLIESAKRSLLTVHDGGVYGVTQGPRLETAAEIDRLARDGCDLVGMTGMPEAALARELGLCYATCAVVANPAAGRGMGAITMEEIQRNLKQGIGHVGKLLETLLRLF